MVWLHQTDKWVGTSAWQTPSLAVPGLMTDDVNWGGDINYSTAWNIHFCAETTEAPYPFYFWINRQSETTGFFCMDSLQDFHSLDTDGVIFYSYPNLGGPHDINTTTNNTHIKGWYLKPNHFVDRTDFASRITNNESRFLPTLILYYNYGNNVAIPSGMPTNIYDSRDELYPIMYCRQTNVAYYNETLSLPPSIKGASSFMMMTASNRNQFDTFNVSNIRDWITCGSDGEIVIPWNGDIINLS
jgi:hypothetical protein